jgi:hypothetical protein
VTKVTIDRTVDRFSRGHNTIHSQMREQGIDPLGCQDDAHFIEKPNAVIVLGASNRSDMRWSFFFSKLRDNSDTKRISSETLIIHQPLAFRQTTSLFN